jgi:D-beta-D-heptose 7-phosphate kinase/D-beta-D-heptose 1-phosphate adenosyltransferase
MKTIVLVTGGFDPIHSGHIAYFNAAKALGDILLVGVNSDAWLTRKKGSPFMSCKERADIVANIKCVDGIVYEFDDADGSSKDAILEVRKQFPEDIIIFANGGDRTPTNIPEMDIQDNNLEFVFGVGGEDKKNSSSWILQEWKAPKTSRQWGHWRILHEQGHEVKLKELTVDPGKRLSMQRHKDRAEHWFVAEGTATVYTVNSASTDEELLGIYEQFQHVHIRQTEWHQLSNETDQPLKIIEIQYGKNCIEEDIERK